MLGAINELKKRLVDWKASFTDITVDVAKKYEAEIEDLVTEDQLLQGKDNKGKPIRPKYSPFTVRIKRLKGQPFDRVTLKDEGDYHRSIDVRFGTGSSQHVFVFFATDEKSEMLERKYGKDLLGLNPESLEEFNNLIRDDLIGSIQKSF